MPLLEQSENTKDYSFPRSNSKSLSSPLRHSHHSQPLPSTKNTSIPPCHLNVPLPPEELSKSHRVDPLGDCSNSSSVHTIVSQHTMCKSSIQEQEQNACIVLSSDDEEDEGHKPYYTNRSFIQRLKQVTVKRDVVNLSSDSII
jgi:hypothetical protein